MVGDFGIIVRAPAEGPNLKPFGVETIVTIASVNPTLGGDDQITLGTGQATVIGGFGTDTISVQAAPAGQGNIILGDNGRATFASLPVSGSTSIAVLTKIETTDQSFGAGDIITSGAGNNIIIGGSGADQITSGAGDTIILGDNGEADFLTPLVSGSVVNGNATYARILSLIVTTAELAAASGGNPSQETSNGTGTIYGGDDIITLGTGNNTVIGGAGDDTIVVGATGVEVIIGDNGKATYTSAGVLSDIVSTYSGSGGVDTISGPNLSFGGSGKSTVIGGAAGDIIRLGGANNTILGDDGEATFGTSGQILTIKTTDVGIGAGDTITVSGGGNVIFGGVGGDAITVQTVGVVPSGNIIMGDDGDAVFTSEPVNVNVSTSVLTSIKSDNQTEGGNDIIITGDGDNVLIGGSGADQITTGAGNNVILGDNGQAAFAVRRRSIR